MAVNIIVLAGSTYDIFVIGCTRDLTNFLDNSTKSTFSAGAIVA
jgi:hypothetical protein